MKKDKIIYWTTTGILSFMMLFSAYSYLTNPQIAIAFKHLGFPDYFRIELAVAKIMGAAILLIPQVSVRIKEWAYAGFGIVFLSASIAHSNSGDPVAVIITPIVFLAVLVVSNIYLHRKRTFKTVARAFNKGSVEGQVKQINKPEFSNS